MALRSWLAVLAVGFLYHVRLTVSQAALNAITPSPTFLQSALPDLAGSNSATPSCGGCYLVADVAGLVWYSEVFVNTAATAMVSVGVGNGTRATRTSVIQNEGSFTYNAGAPGAGVAALTQVNFDSTVNVAGAELTSPTAYNVFTAYSITSAYFSDGLCKTASGSRVQLPSAYSETLSSASGKVYLDAGGQQQFIDFLGFSTCSGGGLNLAATALIHVENTTATMTTTFSGILAAQSVSLTIAPSTPASTSAGPITSSVFPSAAIPKIVIGNKTITPTANPIGLPVFTGATSTPASSIAFLLPSGGSGIGNLSTNATIIFQGQGSSSYKPSAWLSLGTATLFAFAALLYYL